MTYNTYAELNGAAMQLYGEQRFGEVYDLLTSEGDAFPDDMGEILYLRSCMAARGSDDNLAISLLREAQERGIWFGEFIMRETPSWRALQGLPSFEALVSTFGEMEKAAYVGPLRQVIVPEGEPPEAGYPMLISLHGNGGNIAQSVRGWQPAVDMGWLHVALQSSQMAGMNAFIWDDQDTSLRELADHYEAVLEEHKIDKSRVVLGGFSMGGETALRATLVGTLPLEGFILLGPGGPGLDAPDSFTPLIEAAQEAGRGIRGYVLLGENDEQILPDALNKVVGVLNAHGIASKTEQIPGTRHAFPPDFADYVERALHFIEG